MSDPLVSIVTPCYNGERYLDRYFNSILNQTYPCLEVIFVNDGSTDDTKRLAHAYGERLESKGIKYTQLNQDNCGQAAALNNGLKKITGEYFIWPDADDELPVDSIEKRVAFLEKHPQCDYCVGETLGIKEADHSEIKQYRHSGVTDKRELFEGLLWGKDAYYMCGAYMMRTVFLDRIIRDREIFPGRGGQNAQLLLPAAWNGRIGFLNEVVYRYYVRETSHSHSALLKDRNTIQQLKHFETILIETIQRIGMEESSEYIEQVRKHYARLRFGHALNTRDKKLINEQVAGLKELRVFTVKDRYLVFRYINKLMNHIRPVG